MPDQGYKLDGEHETSNGWLYTFTLGQGPDATHHELTLSWVDHEHLVGGSIAPERVAHAAFALAIELIQDALPSRTDISSLRRRFSGFDDLLRERIEAPL